MLGFLGILSFLNIASVSARPILAPIPQTEIVVLQKETVDNLCSKGGEDRYSCELSDLDSATISSGPEIVPLAPYDIYKQEGNREQLLVEAEIDLSKRWLEESINSGFRDNILLGLYYLKNAQSIPLAKPNITGLEGDFWVDFVLEPGQIFAFHKNIKVASDKLSAFVKTTADKQLVSIKTMGSEFLATQGYKVVNGLAGNGVCHLASLINWAASEGGLDVLAPTDHGFAEIEGVPREYWTSIKYDERDTASQNQNLYIFNNKDFAVRFSFEKKGEELKLRMIKI